jgi:hypothetical protein
MNVITTYKVIARRWLRGWELHIEGVGVTQVTRLNQAEGMVRDYVSRALDIDADSVRVDLIPEIGDGLDSSIAESRKALQEADAAQRQAAERSRQVAIQLKSKGLNGVEMARVLGVTPQRVSQILKTAAQADVTGTKGKTSVFKRRGRQTAA